MKLYIKKKLTIIFLIKNNVFLMGLLLFTSYIPNMSLRYINTSLYNYHLWCKSTKKTINQYKDLLQSYKIHSINMYNSI